MEKPNNRARKVRIRRDRVAHVRFSESEFHSVKAAAQRASLSVSGFLRSLSLEGAGVQPFMNRSDQEVMRLLGQDMRIVGNNLTLVLRALNSRSRADDLELAGAVDDARAIANTLMAELARMTKRAGSARRGEEV